MTITKLKMKNQVTIPNKVVKILHLKANELFAVDVEEDYIKLTPVEIEPRYTPEELNNVDRIVDREKARAKVLKPGKEFLKYIKRVTK
ncbi:MAG: AbrB/MazE/SpoVT family DNA-binding domain-containing protein [bacterium]